MQVRDNTSDRSRHGHTKYKSGIWLCSKFNAKMMGQNRRTALGSLGVGLQLSRLMLRIFGGDLIVTNNNVNEGGVCTALLRISYNDTQVITREL